MSLFCAQLRAHSPRWYEDLYLPLYDYYLGEDFVRDPVFLIAGMLDPNGGARKIYENDNDLYKDAFNVTVDYVHALASSTPTTAAPADVPSTTTTNMPPDIAAEMQSQRAKHVQVVTRAASQSQVLAAVAAMWNLVDVDVFEYYSTAGKTWPTVAAAAITVLPIAAGEAAVERVFSLAGTFNAARRRFAPHTLVKVVTCSHSMKQERAQA